MPEASNLVRELEAFKVKINDNAHDSYGAWREGAHDALVLAFPLAMWSAHRDGVGVWFGTDGDEDYGADPLATSYVR